MNRKRKTIKLPKKGGNKIIRDVKYRVRKGKINHLLLIIYELIELLGFDMNKDLTTKIKRAIEEENSRNSELSEDDVIINILNRVYRIEFEEKYYNVE